MGPELRHEHPRETLDLLLAEEILKGGMHSDRLLLRRQQRDSLWMRDVLRTRGIQASDADVQAACQGGPGRFSKGSVPYRLLRRLRLLIDEVDRAAEESELPDREAAYGIAQVLLGRPGEGEGDAAPLLKGEWQEALFARLETEEARRALDPEEAYGDVLAWEGERHPVARAATVLSAWLPFCSVEDPLPYVVGEILASQYLLGQGYPPFHAGQAFESILALHSCHSKDGFELEFARRLLIAHQRRCSGH